MSNAHGNSGEQSQFISQVCIQLGYVCGRHKAYLLWLMNTTILKDRGLLLNHRNIFSNNKRLPLKLWHLFFFDSYLCRPLKIFHLNCILNNFRLLSLQFFILSFLLFHSHKSDSFKVTAQEIEQKNIRLLKLKINLGTFLYFFILSIRSMHS